MMRKTQARTVPQLPGEVPSMAKAEPEVGPGLVAGVTNSQTFRVPLGDVPMDQVETGRIHLNRKLEARLRTRGHQLAMRRLFLGLDRVGARLDDGHRVANNADAIRWLLEQLVE